VRVRSGTAAALIVMRSRRSGRELQAQAQAQTEHRRGLADRCSSSGVSRGLWTVLRIWDNRSVAPAGLGLSAAWTGKEGAALAVASGRRR